MSVRAMKSFAAIIWILLFAQKALSNSQYIDCSGQGQAWTVGDTTYSPFTYKGQPFVSVRCKQGFTLGGRNESVKCLNGKPEKPLPQCIRDPCFSTAKWTVDKATHKQRLYKNGIVKSIFTSCEYNYIALGRQVVFCRNGRHEHPLATCIHSSEGCKNLDPPHGGRKNCGFFGPTVGTNCTFTCNAGYRIVGSTQRACMENLQWSGTQPECFLTPKRPLTNLLASSKKSTNKNLKLPNSCQAGKDCTAILTRSSTSNNFFRHQTTPATTVTSTPKLEIASRVPTLTVEARNPCKDPRRKFCQHECHWNTNGSASCSCNDGYELAQDGRSCIDVDECQRKSSNCSQLCNNFPGGYSCNCHKGYRKASNSLCEDVDECADVKLNRCSDECRNVRGTFVCSCRPGRVLINEFQCEACRKNSFLAPNGTFCTECPPNSHTVDVGAVSIADCICSPGFQGNLSHNIPCEDINECFQNNFGCSHICVNALGGAQCTCRKGYELQMDEKTCDDINECLVKNGGCEGTCHNTNGSYICSCPPGFVISETNRYICDDIDECADRNGGCSHDCMNFHGGFHCSCPDGYGLGPGGKNCSVIQCRRPLVPQFSATVECYHKKNATAVIKLHSRDGLSSHFEVGWICKFSCRLGYSNSLETRYTRIECQNDGTWSAEPTDCKASECPKITAPDNGNVDPPRCVEGRSPVKSKCYFTCNRGYHLKGRPVTTCKNNLTWSNEETRECEPDDSEPYVICQEQAVDLLLDLGQSSANATVALPDTNGGVVEVEPTWVLPGAATAFPAGTTDVKFSVTRNNETATCVTSIHVIDREPPAFYNCPSDIDVRNGSAAGFHVSWREPEASDNVGIKSVSKNMKPNELLPLGTHSVEYIAEDFAGNIANCFFNIHITAMQCSDPDDPLNGEANCMDMMFGRLCEPSCKEGYERDPNEPEFYICDDSGTWKPGNIISPCLVTDQQYFWSIEETGNSKE